MIHIEETARIDAAPSAVWDFIWDASRHPDWIYFVRQVFDTSEGPMREGWIYHERALPGPVESVSEWKITRFEPPHIQVHEGHMSEMDAVLTIRLTSDSGGTRWKHSMAFRMLPGFRPLGWLLERTVVKWRMRADLRKILDAAKNLMNGNRVAEQVGDPQLMRLTDCEPPRRLAA